MFIIVKYGQNESLLCNPGCAVVNLLTSIKRRAGYGNTNLILDLSDETGKTSSVCEKSSCFLGTGPPPFSCPVP